MISFMREISLADLVLCCSVFDLFVLQTFIKSMPQEAKKRKSWRGTSKRNKQEGQQANLASRCSAANKWKSEGHNAFGNVSCWVRSDSLNKNVPNLCKSKGSYICNNITIHEGSPCRPVIHDIVSSVFRPDIKKGKNLRLSRTKAN